MALITLFTTISYLVYPHFFYLYTQYQVRHRQIMIKRHVWFQKTEVIKLERIQFVKRSSGPLLRHHNLCILTLTTAAHEVKFPYLSVDEAKRLESYCLNHIKRGDDDV
nr:PH domain-containing protein [Staphylococcus canis]